MVNGGYYHKKQHFTQGGSNADFSTNYNFVHSILKHFIEVVQGGVEDCEAEIYMALKSWENN